MPDDEGAGRRSGTGLAAGLAGLSRLVAGRGTLEQVLTEISTFALEAIPGADGVGVTMIGTGTPDTMVASTSFVRDVDAIQYRLGEGPCISAAATATTTGSGGLGDDDAWPSFGPLAAALGINSALSLPLVMSGTVLGALNVYAHALDAFDDHARRIGESFAGPAAVAVHNAGVLDKAQRLAVNLEAALVTRGVIDRAIGIIQGRAGISEDEAFARIRIISQHEHVKVRLVAARIVDEAVRRAQSRGHRPPGDGAGH